jgi:hypothetical protein
VIPPCWAWKRFVGTAETIFGIVIEGVLVAMLIQRLFGAK